MRVAKTTAVRTKNPIRHSSCALAAAAACLLFVCTATAAEEPWQLRYQRAQDALVVGNDAEAARLFDALALTARTPGDRQVAEEMAKLARARIALAERKWVAPHIRTSDELSLLYTTAFVYGLGTSAWLALVVKPKTFAAAVVPFALVTTASVGAVAVVDDYRPFRLGVPQSISAGMFLGVGEGAWITGYQHAVASRREAEHWQAPIVSTLLWSGATLGGLAGGAVGAWREPTPGRVSFATSASLWPGLSVALAAAALRSDETRRNETAFAAGAIAYNLGLGSALVFGPEIDPSVARVRFVDLGGLAGTLLGMSSYLLAAGEGNTSRGMLASAAIGSGVGLGLAWWLTADMPHDARTPANVLSTLQPMVTPSEHGLTLGVAGVL